MNAQTKPNILLKPIKTSSSCSRYSRFVEIKIQRFEIHFIKPKPKLVHMKTQRWIEIHMNTRIVVLKTYFTDIILQNTKLFYYDM